jgi:hypothetical protein
MLAVSCSAYYHLLHFLLCLLQCYTHIPVGSYLLICCFLAVLVTLPQSSTGELQGNAFLSICVNIGTTCMMCKRRFNGSITLKV